MKSALHVNLCHESVMCVVVQCERKNLPCCQTSRTKISGPLNLQKCRDVKKTMQEQGKPNIIENKLAFFDVSFSIGKKHIFV